MRSSQNARLSTHADIRCFILGDDAGAELRHEHLPLTPAARGRVDREPKIKNQQRCLEQNDEDAAAEYLGKNTSTTAMDTAEVSHTTAPHGAASHNPTAATRSITAKNTVAVRHATVCASKPPSAVVPMPHTYPSDRDPSQVGYRHDAQKQDQIFGPRAGSVRSASGMHGFEQVARPRRAALGLIAHVAQELGRPAIGIGDGFKSIRRPGSGGSRREPVKDLPPSWSAPWQSN